MSLINVMNLTFAYEGSSENIFENISFQIDSNWKLGFSGRNGRGKTTFLKLLQNAYPYQGQISSNVDFEYFPYSINNENLSTLEIVASIYSDFEMWELEYELSLLNVDASILKRSYLTLSNGEKTKVLLATLFLKPNSFLLIDEPTNHLDRAGREIVCEYLRFKKGFILVSHDQNFLDNCIDHILVINKNNIEVKYTNFSSWLYNKELQDQGEIELNRKLIKDIKKLEASSKRTAEWSNTVEKSKIGCKGDKGYIGHKAAKMMKRSKNIEHRQLKVIEDKKDLLKNIEECEDLKIHPLKYHSNNLLTLDNISIYYGNVLIKEHISFSINKGDRLFLSGNNGCGKSTLLKLIAEERITFTGQLLKNPQLKISYVTQDTTYLTGTLDAYALSYDIDKTLFKTILRKLDFTRNLFEKQLQFYSEGQKRKVLIARSLCEKAHLYIWDEPLNYIDIFSRHQIEALLLKYQPTMILVEHDSYFQDLIATKIIDL